MDSLTLVIFGITGNLSQIKLLPALYDMAEKGLLPADFHIIGNARKAKSRNELEDYIRQTIGKTNKHHQHEIKESVLNELISKIDYLDGHLDDPEFYTKLNAHLAKINSKNRIYYLATYPDLYHQIFENLKKAGLENQKAGFSRLIIEKPIGNDLSSAKKLNQLLKKYFSEDQIFRLDHYLGKETLQNILTFRFGNSIFEPLMNSQFIDHIQITAAEDFGIGARGGYYDTVGALRDVGQNHQLQMIAFALMNAPIEFTNQAITKERLKVLKSLLPLPDKTIFGQYQGYQQEENVSSQSNTDTFYAFKTFAKLPKLKNIPIYVRGGKKLVQTVTEISIVFKKPKNRFFDELTKNKSNVLTPSTKEKGQGSASEQYNNLLQAQQVLIFRLQPNEGIVVKIQTKKPGPDIELEEDYMQFCYRQLADSHYFPDPYEKLLVDTIRGDQTFFNDAAEVEAQWAFIDPLVKNREKPQIYTPGSWGPKEADELMAKDGRAWLEPSMDFCKI